MAMDSERLSWLVCCPLDVTDEVSPLSLFSGFTGAHSQVTTFQVPHCISGDWALIQGEFVLLCFMQALGMELEFHFVSRGTWGLGLEQSAGHRARSCVLEASRGTKWKVVIETRASLMRKGNQSCCSQVFPTSLNAGLGTCDFYSAGFVFNSFRSLQLLCRLTFP